MCIAEIPNLLFYAYLPSIFLGIIFGVFIYLQNKKASLNIVLMTISLVFSMYATIDFLTWFPWKYEMYLIFQRMLILTLVLLPLFIYFALYLSETKLTKFKHCLIWAPLAPIFLLNFSKYTNLIFTIEFEKTNCVVVAGPFYNYIYFLSALYLLTLFGILIYKFGKNLEDDMLKKRIRLVIAAVSFFVVWFSLLIKLQDYFGDNSLIFIPLGMVIFIGMLIYTISKYKLFNIKLLFAQAIVVGLIFFLVAELFFVENTNNRVLIFITLIISIGFGYMLVKSVKLEVKQKEELEVANKEISERKEQLQKIADSLAVANDKLRQLDQAKSDFINIASHQLKKAPTPIKGYASLLLEGSYGKLMPEQEEAIKKIDVANDRQINLVGDLLDIARIESGRMEFNFEKINPIVLCQEVYDNLATMAKDKGLDFQYEKPNKVLPEILIDRSKMFEAIFNFAENAIKYTPKGSVKLKVEQRIDNIRISVTDTGVGINKEDLPNLFEKFSRGKGISHVYVEGSGLGLYVVRLMVEAHGGRTWAESDGENKGSRFIIEIPIKQTEKNLEKQN